MATKPVHYIPLSPDHYTAIGRVAVEWSALERVISDGIAAMLGIGYRDAIAVTAHAGFIQQVDMFFALARRKVSDTDGFEDLRSRLNKIRDDTRNRRNQVVHASWVLPEGSPSPFAVRRKARGEVKFERQDFSADSINALADEIATECQELLDLFARHIPKFLP